MIKEIIIHTPIWVFGLFLGLLVLGLQQSKARNVKKIMVYPMPIGIIILSFFGVSSSFGYSLAPISLWFLGLGLSTLTGAIYFPIKGASYSDETGTYSLKGSWIPLIFMMLIFFTKYVVGVMSALKFPILSSSSFIYSLSALYGIFSGIFASRAVSLWQTGSTSLARSIA